MPNRDRNPDRLHPSKISFASTGERSLRTFAAGTAGDRSSDRRDQETNARSRPRGILSFARQRSRRGAIRGQGRDRAREI